MLRVTLRQVQLLRRIRDQLNLLEEKKKDYLSCLEEVQTN